MQIKVAHSDATETIDPSRLQVDAMSIPDQSTVELLESCIADCQTVDQDVISRILAQTLLVVVHGCVNLALFRALQTFLLPE